MDTEKLVEKKKATLKDLYGLKSVTSFKDKDTQPIAVACPSLLYGVELEIENIPGWMNTAIPGTSWKEDHSLRNSGMELVTQPMTLSVLNTVLDKFFNKIGLTARNYSERCSVHIHANCLDMSMSQIASVCLLYQVFELVLFNWIGNDRDKNIFCVPWYETTLNYNVINDINTTEPATKLHRWQKYTALNLLPLFKFGTLEFRHMSGTNDLTQIIKWCNMIGCLFEMAKTQSLEDIKKYVIDLNSTSAYKTTIDTVFKQWAEDLRNGPYESMLEEGILNMKYSLMVPEKSGKKYEKYVPIFDTIGGGVNPPIRTEILYAAQPTVDRLQQNQLERNWLFTPPVPIPGTTGNRVFFDDVTFNTQEDRR